MLAPTSSVEHVRLNRFGYSAAGRYYGRGVRVYRLADSTTQLDFTVRCGSRKQAIALLASAVSIAYEQHAFWLRQVEAATPDECDSIAWRIATRHAVDRCSV